MQRGEESGLGPQSLAGGGHRDPAGDQDWIIKVSIQLLYLEP